MAKINVDNKVGTLHYFIARTTLQLLTYPHPFSPKL